MKYQDLIAQIEKLRDKPAREDSFSRAKAALTDLNLPLGDFASRSVVVAGTNGKGTVCKTLEVLLSSLGFRVGLFTSPHLLKTTERIRSIGADLSESEFVAAYEQIAPVVNKYELSHFEILTLMAAVSFFSQTIRPDVDYVVWEVGVGGRLDPTNLFPHQTSVITKLGYDHMALLGNSLAEIAREKLGIVHKNNLVVHLPFPEEVRPEAEKRKQELGGRWICVESSPVRVQPGVEPRFFIQTSYGEVPLQLPGARAAENMSLALRVFSELGFDAQKSFPVLAQVQWPGRMEKVLSHRWPRPVYLSGDHNVQGVESLRELLTAYEYEKIHVILGVGKNKDFSAMWEAFEKIPRAEFYLTENPFRPGGGPTDLTKFKFVEPDPLRCLERVVAQSSPREMVLVTGSLYLVGDVRRALLETP